MVQFYSKLEFGVGMSLWSQAIGLHIKMSITNLVMGCKGHVKQHTIDHKQGLGFTRIQCKNSSYTLFREGLSISPPQIQAHPIPTKINLPNSQGYGARFGFTIYFSNSQTKLFQCIRSSKFPNCERDNLKSFFNILRAYKLNQQKKVTQELQKVLNQKQKSQHINQSKEGISK